MRINHYTNLGFTPTDLTVAGAIAERLKPSGTGVFTALDVCAGEGVALDTLANGLRRRGADVKTAGIELSKDRFKAAANILDVAVFGDNRFTAVPAGAFSMVLINPPYDQDARDSTFWRSVNTSIKALCQGGIAIFVIPQKTVGVLSKKHFEWLFYAKSPDPKSPTQVILIGRRSNSRGELPGIVAVNGKPFDTPQPLPWALAVRHIPDIEVPPVSRFAPPRKFFSVGARDIANELRGVHPSLEDAQRHYGVSFAPPKPLLPLPDAMKAALVANAGTTVYVDGVDGGRYLTVKPEYATGVQGNKVTATPTLKVVALEKSPLTERVEIRERSLVEVLDVLGEVAQSVSQPPWLMLDEDGAPVLRTEERAFFDEIARNFPVMKRADGTRVQGLLPYQQAAVAAALRAFVEGGTKGLVLMAPVGTGKTPMASTIAYAMQAFARKRGDLACVVAPSRLTQQWRDELKKFFPDAEVFLIDAGMNYETRQQVFRKAVAAGERNKAARRATHALARVRRLRRMPVPAEWREVVQVNTVGALTDEDVLALQTAGIDPVQTLGVETLAVSNVSPSALAPDVVDQFTTEQARIRRLENEAAAGKPVFIVVSDTAMKLGPEHRPTPVRGVTPGIGFLAACPHCGMPMVARKPSKGLVADISARLGNVARYIPGKAEAIPQQATDGDADQGRRLWKSLYRPAWRTVWYSWAEGRKLPQEFVEAFANGSVPPLVRLFVLAHMWLGRKESISLFIKGMVLETIRELPKKHQQAVAGAIWPILQNTAVEYSRIRRLVIEIAKAFGLEGNGTDTSLIEAFEQEVSAHMPDEVKRTLENIRESTLILNLGIAQATNVEVGAIEADFFKEVCRYKLAYKPARKVSAASTTSRSALRADIVSKDGSIFGDDEEEDDGKKRPLGITVVYPSPYARRRIAFTRRERQSHPSVVLLERLHRWWQHHQQMEDDALIDAIAGVNQEQEGEDDEHAIVRAIVAALLEDPAFAIDRTRLALNSESGQRVETLARALLVVAAREKGRQEQPVHPEHLFEVERLMRHRPLASVFAQIASETASFEAFAAVVNKWLPTQPQFRRVCAHEYLVRARQAASGTPWHDVPQVLGWTTVHQEWVDRLNRALDQVALGGLEAARFVNEVRQAVSSLEPLNEEQWQAAWRSLTTAGWILDALCVPAEEGTARPWMGLFVPARKRAGMWGAFFQDISREKGVAYVSMAVDLETFDFKGYRGKRCPFCNTPYYSKGDADSMVSHRRPFAWQFYDAVRASKLRLFLILDEVHEGLRNPDTLTALSVARLVRTAWKMLAMTATFSNGKASSLHVLAKLVVSDFRRHFAHMSPTEFARAYGCIAATFESEEEAASRAMGRTASDVLSGSRRIEEAPGIDLRILGHMLGQVIYVPPPPPPVPIHWLPLNVTNEVAKTPSPFAEGGWPSAAKVAREVGTLVHEFGTPAATTALRGYRKAPFIYSVNPDQGKWVDGLKKASHVFGFAARDAHGRAIREVTVLGLIAQRPPVIETVEGVQVAATPTERTIVDVALMLRFLRQQLAKRLANEGLSPQALKPPRLLVVVEDSNVPPLPHRLIQVCEEAGLSVAYLEASKIPTARRAGWFKQQQDKDVVIVPLQAVQSGLNLVDWSVMLFYGVTGTNPTAIEQVAGRIDRATQTIPVVYIPLVANDLGVLDWLRGAAAAAWARFTNGGAPPGTATVFGFRPKGTGALDMVSALADVLNRASVPLPEGWRKVFTVYSRRHEGETAFEQLPIPIDVKLLTPRHFDVLLQDVGVGALNGIGADIILRLPPECITHLAKVFEETTPPFSEEGLDAFEQMKALYAGVDAGLPRSEAYKRLLDIYADFYDAHIARLKEEMKARRERRGLHVQPSPAPTVEAGDALKASPPSPVPETGAVEFGDLPLFAAAAGNGATVSSPSSNGGKRRASRKKSPPAQQLELPLF